MGGGGGGDYKPDPNVGLAALKSAKVGKKYLKLMKEQMAVSNEWASQDRARYEDTFQPLEDRFIKTAKRYDSPWRQRQAGSEAKADVAQQAQLAKQQSNREMAAMGVNPKSGRYKALNRSINFDTALSKAGAATLARKGVRDKADMMMSSAINLGKGFAVNPATSLGLSNSAASSGFSGAMQGYNQQGQMLAQQDRNQLYADQMQQQNNSGLFGALGTAAGLMPWGSINSDEDKKEGIKEPKKALPALRDLGIKSYAYKPEVGDAPGKRHTGPMAQDWKKATGSGDGKTIDAQDAIGVTMQAVKELDKKVDGIARGIKRRKA